ncbi:MAG: hypothetical protein R3286_11700 [Gammaproteobacteria bacterium]|nr:hypothetical protein [Gammaproteobacteria bacterium]
MTDDKLLAMSEAQIRARYRGAPAYYMQAKIEKLRALQGRRSDAPKSEPPTRIQPTERRAKKAPAASARKARPAVRPAREPVRIDVALPGFEILDAALSALDEPRVPAAHTPAHEPLRQATQQSILEATLEDYSNWPLLDDEPAPAPKASPKRKSDLESRLALLLEAEPELELVLESDADLAPVAPAAALDNVTVGAFGGAHSDDVHVVSVAMDRKRPYMVRVVGKTTRRAS